MNFKIIALALVITSPALSAHAENLRNTRETREIPPREQPTTTETPTTTVQVTTTETPSTNQNGRTIPPDSQSSPYSPSQTQTRNRAPQPPQPSHLPSPSTITTGSDCITYSILNPFKPVNIDGKCEYYTDPDWNYYCDFDIDSNGILAEDACPECGKCTGPENMGVAFSTKTPFNAGFGTCSTYEEDIYMSNWGWCDEDEVDGIFAFQACEECNKVKSSAPRTVKIRLMSIKCTNSTDLGQTEEIYGSLGSEVGREKRYFWKEGRDDFLKLELGENYPLFLNHYYYDVGDMETITVQGTLSEYDYDMDPDDSFGSQHEHLNVGDLYFSKQTQTVPLEWRYKGSNIAAYFYVSVY